jgi:hypothetical protein
MEPGCNAKLIVACGPKQSDSCAHSDAGNACDLEFSLDGELMRALASLFTAIAVLGDLAVDSELEST